MRRSINVLFAVVALAFALPAAPVFAVDDAPAATPTPVACKAPEVPNADKSTCVPCAKGTKYDEAKKICVTVNASLMDDRALYEQGRALALAGYYQDALATFAAIKNQNDAMTLTMIGYSQRKLGHTEEGIAIYHQALALDPDNVHTHEYLGEGYLAAGRVDLAELELDTLAKLCGTTCEQYRDLQTALIGDGVWH
ncbi:MAG: tetratricopeptide repeat protein [Bauldia sp.]